MDAQDELAEMQLQMETVSEEMMSDGKFHDEFNRAAPKHLVLKDERSGQAGPLPGLRHGKMEVAAPKSWAKMESSLLLLPQDGLLYLHSAPCFCLYMAPTPRSFLAPGSLVRSYTIDRSPDPSRQLHVLGHCVLGGKEARRVRQRASRPGVKARAWHREGLTSLIVTLLAWIAQVAVLEGRP